MITTTRSAFRAATTGAGRVLGECSQLTRDLDQQITQLTSQMQEVAQSRARERRCDRLGKLREASVQAQRALTGRVVNLAGGCATPQPELSNLRQQAVILRQLDTLMKSGVKLMQAYRDQMPFEPPLMTDVWARRLGDDLRTLCACLGASSKPQVRDLAALAIAITPPDLRQAVGMTTVRVVPERMVEAWLLQHDGRTLNTQQLLALRLGSHPDSGVCAAFSSLEALERLHPALAEAAGHLFPELEALRQEAVEAAYQLSGLRMTHYGRAYFKGLSGQDTPQLEALLSPYAEFTLKRPTSTASELPQADIGARGPRPPLDVMLHLQCGGPGGGAVDAVRADLFHPEPTWSRAAALLLPGQSFRVMPAWTQLHRDPEGGSTEVRHFHLNKVNAPGSEPDKPG